MLGDDESVPDVFVLEFCDRAIQQFGLEVAGVQGRDEAVEEQAKRRVVDALVGEFHQTASSRGWTVGDGRIRQLAGDAIGLSLEFEHDHGYELIGARLAAVRECLEGEQARELIAAYEREDAAEVASQRDRSADAAAETPAPPRVDRGVSRTRAGGER
jgi:hypothetical protein